MIRWCCEVNSCRGVGHRITTKNSRELGWRRSCGSGRRRWWRPWRWCGASPAPAAAWSASLGAAGCTDWWRRRCRRCTPRCCARTTSGAPASPQGRRRRRRRSRRPPWAPRTPPRRRRPWARSWYPPARSNYGPCPPGQPPSLEQPAQVVPAAVAGLVVVPRGCSWRPPPAAARGCDPASASPGSWGCFPETWCTTQPPPLQWPCQPAKSNWWPYKGKTSNWVMTISNKLSEQVIGIFLKHSINFFSENVRNKSRQAFMKNHIFHAHPVNQNQMPEVNNIIFIWCLSRFEALALALQLQDVKNYDQMSPEKMVLTLKQLPGSKWYSYCNHLF